MNEDLQYAYFALGCFWEPDDFFPKLTGVVETEVGYSGGQRANPTYRNIGDHSETIKITFNPTRVSYPDLLQAFWDAHDPTHKEKLQYASKIFYVDDLQHEEAEASWLEQQKLHNKPLTTEVVKFEKFWRAEEYHQKYLAKERAKDSK